MDQRKITSLFFIVFIIASMATAYAYVPRLISLQGKLTDVSGAAITAPTRFIFRIYDVSTGGAALWTEIQASVTPDTDGIFSVLLGSVSQLNIPFDRSYWLDVEIGPAGSSQILSPRQRIGSAGYSIQSESPWNSTGTNVYTPVTTNVGLGTSSPNAKLDVTGTSLLRSAATVGQATTFTGNNPRNLNVLGEMKSFGAGSGLRIEDRAATSDTNKEWVIYPNSNYLRFWSGLRGDLMAINYDTGNVGIGITTPGTKLVVVGNVTVSGNGNGIFFPDGSFQSRAGGSAAGSCLIDGDGDGWTLCNDACDNNPAAHLFGAVDADGDGHTAVGSCGGAGDDNCDTTAGAWLPMNTDADNDGHSPATACPGGAKPRDDCNDACATCYPGSTSYGCAADSLDQDCDGSTDEWDFGAWSGVTSWCGTAGTSAIASLSASGKFPACATCDAVRLVEPANCDATWQPNGVYCYDSYSGGSIRGYGSGYKIGAAVYSTQGCGNGMSAISWWCADCSSPSYMPIDGVWNNYRCWQQAWWTWCNWNDCAGVGGATYQTQVRGAYRR